MKLILIAILLTGCTPWPPEPQAFHLAKHTDGLCLAKANYYAQAALDAGHAPEIAIIHRTDTVAHAVVTFDRRTWYDPSTGKAITNPTKIHFTYTYRGK